MKQPVRTRLMHHIVFAILLSVGWFLLAAPAFAQKSGDAHVTVAQISDTHIGDKHAPHAAENLKRAVDMVNDRNPDVVILSGDIGENPKAWDDAKSILKKLKPPIYYVPGNHDVHSNDVDRYRKAFGKDYYDFEVKNVKFVVIDSQLLGNYDVFGAKNPEPLPSGTEEESEAMLSWLTALQGDEKSERREEHRERRAAHSHLPRWKLSRSQTLLGCERALPDSRNESAKATGHSTHAGRPLAQWPGL